MRIEMTALFMMLLASAADAEGQAITFGSGVRFETGDAWTHGSKRYRLFGVQACIRGTGYRSQNGEEGDCGMRSIASLAALFSTNTIACQPIQATAADGAILVVCAAEIDGSTIDVGTALISSGAAFAAILPSGIPVNAAYAIAESTAKESRSGLWSGAFEHPIKLLMAR